MSEQQTCFFAYSASPRLIGEVIEAAARALEVRPGPILVATWRQTDVAGKFVADQVVRKISDATHFAADVTVLNFNVTYEVGFAIGAGKAIRLIRHAAVDVAKSELSELGVFDSIGYSSYENSHDLAEVLRQLPAAEPLKFNPALNTRVPVYLLEARFKTDPVTRIVSRIKKAGLRFRSFDPNEQSRMSAPDTIDNVAQSLGVVSHLIPATIADARIHNLRAAFIAGLAAGMRKLTLFLQDGDEPVPVDYRDLVRSYRFPAQIDEAIADFAPQVVALYQEDRPTTPVGQPSLLERISLGASAAENELDVLGQYYLRTDTFQRSLRGEVGIVVGRKGSGKTAVFAQVRDRARQDRLNIVLDLKPEGYKLLRFKRAVLELLDEGSFEHTITAFWEYLLLLELCHKVLEKDRVPHTRSTELYGPYRRLADLYDADDFVTEGDFSERMSKLIGRISDDYAAKYGTGRDTLLSSAAVTELLYKHDVARLRDELVEYLRLKGEVYLLFDNVDKGWPAHGLTHTDLVIIRALIEASRKVERHLGQRGIEAHSIVFLRNDVYALLVDETADRGKESTAVLDWTDGDLLREIVRRRLIYSGIKDTDFFAVWHHVCVSHIDGEESSQYLIDRSLMRPRCLIDLINYCRSSAVNLIHEVIDESDISKGLALYSSDLLLEIDLEIRDVFPQGEDVVYRFYGEAARLSGAHLSKLLAAGHLDAKEHERVRDLLLWYGFLGFVSGDATEDALYIYAVNYDMRLMRGVIAKTVEGERVFEINPAFRPALSTP
jgi:hypothetical protein